MGNPIGFWAFFFVLAIIVILLAAGPLAWVISLFRQAQNRVDPEQVQRDKDLDKIEAEQRRLDEQLEEMRSQLKTIRGRDSRTPPTPPSPSEHPGPPGSDTPAQ